MKKFRRIVCLCLAMCMLWNTQLDIKAATASQVQAYGFNVASEGYKYSTYFNNPTVMNVYTASGIYIGSSVVYVARARSTTVDASGYYYDTLLVRADMEPVVTKSGGTYYRGLNNQNKATMTLNSNQKYVNIAPTATMPESSSTWDVSFSANGNNAKEFGFEIGTGYSSTIKDNCFVVSSNYTSANKKYVVAYDYSVSANIISTAARKAINKWCTNTHQCFYAFTYRTPTTNTTNMKVLYNVNFRYAKNDSSSWNGSTWDVVLDSSGRSDAINVTYLSSN